MSRTFTPNHARDGAGEPVVTVDDVVRNAITNRYFRSSDQIIEVLMQNERRHIRGWTHIQTCERAERSQRIVQWF